MSEITRAEVQKDLQEIFRRIFNKPALVLTDATTSADIEGWDSLQQIKIILACEKKLHIRLRARDINALENMGEMIDHLLAAIEKAARK
jgi:acyl carrier protein